MNSLVGIVLLLLLIFGWRQINNVQEAFDFVPVEDKRVPTHASYSNKFNDVIGNYASGLMGPAEPEVVVPSDWYMSRTLPTEFDGPYWPNGGIQPDFIYPGSEPARPLRPYNWNAAYYRTLGA